MFFEAEAGVVEAEAGAFVHRLGGEERLENERQMAGLDAGPGVRDADADGWELGPHADGVVARANVGVQRGGQCDAPAFGHGFSGVEREAEQGLMQFGGVSVDGQRFSRELGGEFNALGNHFADEVCGFGDEGVEVVIGAVAGAYLMKLDEALDNLRGLERALLQKAEAFVEGMSRRGLAVVGLAQTEDAADDVVEIMRQAEREQAEGFLPRGRGQAAFGNGQARMIGPEAFVAHEPSGVVKQRATKLGEAGDASRDGVTEAEVVRETLGYLSDAREAEAEIFRVRFMENLPEEIGVTLPAFEREAGEFRQARAGEFKREVGALAEEDSGPVLSEILNVNGCLHARGRADRAAALRPARSLFRFFFVNGSLGSVTVKGSDNKPVFTGKEQNGMAVGNDHRLG